MIKELIKLDRAKLKAARQAAITHKDSDTHEKLIAMFEAQIEVLDHHLRSHYRREDPNAGD